MMIYLKYVLIASTLIATEAYAFQFSNDTEFPDDAIYVFCPKGEQNVEGWKAFLPSSEELFNLIPYWSLDWRPDGNFKKTAMHFKYRKRFLNRQTLVEGGQFGLVDDYKLQCRMANPETIDAFLFERLKYRKI